MLNVIICGAPGCGKGTQSALIVEKYRLKHLSTGELLRNEIYQKSELGQLADTYISKGNLVPDNIMIDVLVKAIDQPGENINGIILDGFPRTLAQAEALEDMLNQRNKKTNVFLDLEVENRELISRLLKRGEVSGRSDDNLETIKKRLEVYKTKTLPVHDYYKKIGKYVSVNGMGTVDEIFKQISAVLDEQR